MATLVLSAAGAAIGSGFGGTILGLSGAVIGRAIGATIGRSIDQRLIGGSEAVETGRIDRLRLTGADEGAPIPRLWGRMRIGAQIIWASPFEEHASRRRGGKGGGGTVTEYAYSVSLAIGLCQGEILKLGRIWAEGEEISPDSLTLRLYKGDEDQLPDPKLEAVLGEGRAPAFRGLAYVVIEDLDLSRWGNRVPFFTFEVARAAAAPGAPGLDQVIRAVAMIPGTGEYALATTVVHAAVGPGEMWALNANSPSGRSDFVTSLDHLTGELPRCGSVSLVVSWFGDDLRCGECRIRPKVEQKEVEGQEMPWTAGGIGRAEAEVIARFEGRSIYGGTPSDASVIEAIRALHEAGLEVMFYPFLLMEQLPGNGRPNPLTGEGEQPALPWRGRITTALAPHLPGTTDRSAAAEAEVAAFFGAAAPGDFTLSGERVNYHGPEDWGLRRFILHYAWLCQAAGGVESFCIGSEFVGLTRIRGADDSFPAVAELKRLAAEVKSILGPGCQVSYAADWTEYGAYVADGNVYFPLDPLWADPAVDFIGIDNYMPLADWREGLDHADAGSPHALAYLMANIEGGEGYDWYYDSPEGEAAQQRRPITDGAFDEPWIYRVKDLRNWWSQPHHPREGTSRATVPTQWQPMSKPIRFTEYGCAAIDHGANHPNRFLALHSSESLLPRGSQGRRDDLMQMQYLRAMHLYWSDPAKNPVSPLYGGAMIDMSRAHAWAWDARPFPFFPARDDLWSDAAAYGRGHWLNGRATNQPLSSVLSEICRELGVEAATEAAEGVVRGYLQDQVQTGRAVLQPLMLAHALDAVDRDGKLHFLPRRAGTDAVIDPAELADLPPLDGYAEQSRSPDPEVAGAVRLSFVDAEASYDLRHVEARLPDEGLVSVASSEFPMLLTSGEARGIAHRWLAESRIARDALRLALPPSRLEVGAGTRLALPDGTTWRVDRVELAEARLVEAVRFEGTVYAPADFPEDRTLLRPHLAPVPVEPVFLDLPLLTGNEVPHQPHVAVAAEPWHGPVAVWGQIADGGFERHLLLTLPAIMGVSESDLPRARPGVWDRGPGLRVRLIGGALQSVTETAVLNGANAMVIGDGSPGHWEIFQFAEAELVAPRTWQLRKLLRGQQGSDGLLPDLWPAGSRVVLLDRALQQLDLPASARGLEQLWRIGLNARGFDAPTVVERRAAFEGIGLRPWLVAHLRATGAPGTDMTFRWIRRTRIDGDPWEAPEVPLGEEGELYLLQIRAGAELRREVMLDAPGFSYPAALQAADGVTAGFNLSVAQVSARFGPGPFRSIRLEA